MQNIHINNDDLTAFAENAARGMKPNDSLRGSDLAKRIVSQLREIRMIRDGLERNGDAKDVAREWLLDNYYIARREGISAAREFNSAGRFRALDSGGIIVEKLSASLVRAGRGAVDKKRCELFLSGFQTGRPLSQKELAFFPFALRAALISELLEQCRSAQRAGDTGFAAAEGMERVFTSLRLLGTVDLSDMLERVDQTEQILRTDPAGIYPYMDEKTRTQYRARVSKLAKRTGTVEYRVARQAIKHAQSGRGRSRHVGYYLFTEPLGGREKAVGGFAYIAGNVLLTLFFSLLEGFIFQSVAVTILTMIPVSELIKNILDAVFLRLVKPRHIPRMELKDGVPTEGKTLCVIVSLLADSEGGQALTRKMEEYRLANRDAGSNLSFGLLLDLPEGREKEIEGAQQWIGDTVRAVEQLNKEYGGGFFLLLRERTYAARDGLYMGWERKRGALTELMMMLRKQKTSINVLAGDEGRLESTSFVLTLDADTRLEPGCARELIGAMLHPLVRPVIDTKRRMVISGHGVIQPRMSSDLDSDGRTEFSRIYAGQGGTDPYGGASGEIYMDCFERGGFAGKGIIDIDAFMLCMSGRVPENAVLSHDTIEGAYLRGGYMGDVELTDGFPSNVRSFFRRLERWTRGDWQNCPWLFRRGRDMNEIERWRIFDSLRRSLVAPVSLVAMIMFFLFPSQAFLSTAGITLLSLSSPLLLSVREAAGKKRSGMGVRYHSSIVHGVGGAFMRTLLRLLLLPYEGWICAGAIFTALWRMAVSKKKMLAWQPAAQADRAKNSVSGNYCAMWPAAVAGVICLILSKSFVGIAAGIIWAASPAIAAALSREKKREAKPDVQEREYLLECAREMWRYFDEFCNEENNYLPPDNFQQSPPVGVAQRASPTNIGMALLSMLSAARLEIESQERAIELIEHMLGSIERLEKWKGHLLNWYDTTDLSPLRPKYVSTVDSGNLAGCLIVLREGMRGLGREDIAKRIDAILSPMDFSILYDDSRRLFRIGIDLGTGEPTEGWYDLMSSEARLAGYIAIARGDVERRHWRKLGRSQVQKDGYRGMVSWTGTMFEYLMPELILPVYRDSLLYETAQFCVHVQRRRTAGSGKPWGISESAFFSLDQSLDYRYKAHGCAALALKRGQDKELVISPYSTFLTLTVCPEGAVNNLKLLEGLGARGKYGFWEAVDFTPSRCVDKKGAVVRCVMAHHVGMSICAVADRLCDGYLQDLFMSDPEMSAHSGLLQERVPVGGVLLDSREKDIPEKPAGRRAAVWRDEGRGVDFQCPKATLLSNGTYRMIVAESGVSLAYAGEIVPYRNPRRPIGDGAGVDFGLRTDAGRIPLLPISEPNSGGNVQWELTSRKAGISVVRSGVRATVESMVSASAAGELRRVRISPMTENMNDCVLEMEFEPLLAKEKDYVNHPTFYRLGLEKKQEGNLCFIRRLARGSMPERWMCVNCDKPMTVTEYGRGALKLSVSLSLRAGKETVAEFAIALGDTENEARNAALAILSMPEENAADLVGACAALLSMDNGQVAAAMEVLPELLFPNSERNEQAKPSAEGKEGLWRFGISGDLPITCIIMEGLEELSAAEVHLRRHTLLTACGMDYDLAIFVGDGGDYRRPCTTALWGLLRTLDRESAAGERGGVHFVDSGGDTDALIQSASAVFKLSLPREKRKRRTDLEYIMSTQLKEARNCVPECDLGDDGSISFKTSRGLPKRAWGNMLTNGHFGYFATDCGTGHMWYENAREYRVGRWENDAWSTSGTETLEIIMSTKRHSLFAVAGEKDGSVTYSRGAACWEKTVGDTRIKTTSFVPTDVDARVFIIECQGGKGAQIAWQTELVLSGDDGDAVQVTTDMREGVLTARNPRGAFPDATVKVLSSVMPLRFTCDRAAWERGEPHGETGAGYDPCFAAVYPAGDVTILVCGCGDDATLRALTIQDNARAALEKVRDYWQDICGRISVKTPDEVLNNYINGWAVYQALACRMMGRTSIYQSGGAYGYRDQLQDAVNLLPVMPELTHEQILTACEHQYEQGDVQHWWHPVDGPEKGVRTRCSDDLLWLPWALCEYVERTGDREILTQQRHYLSSPILAANEHDRYEAPSVSEKKGSVMEHASRALEMVIRRGTGENGLLLVGTGDWNDGMDKVGERGHGESVWLSWFFSHTARRFAALCGDEHLAEQAEIIGKNADSAWDGGWYLRGYFDDGSPLGSICTQGGCQIDSIAQSFSVLCENSDPEKRRTALKNALDRLFDRERGIVKLFDPPFSDAPRDPGYIQSYGKGFRENGGQYTHAAIWLSMACLREGMLAEGYEILRALLPENHDLAVYQAEPYVIAADVYTADGREGEAGWSWYTGSAGWFFRMTLEELLGIKQRGGRLFIEPRIPDSWNSFEVKWNDRNIVVSEGAITVDGKPYDSKKGIF